MPPNTYVRNRAKDITELEAIIFREFYMFSKPDELTQYFSIFSTVALK